MSPDPQNLGFFFQNWGGSQVSELRERQKEFQLFVRTPFVWVGGFLQWVAFPFLSIARCSQGLRFPQPWYNCLNSQNAQKCLREGAKGVFGPPK